MLLTGINRSENPNLQHQPPPKQVQPHGRDLRPLGHSGWSAGALEAPRALGPYGIFLSDRSAPT